MITGQEHGGISTARPFDGSNYLIDVAARIKTEHEAVSLSLKESVRHAIVAGTLLIEAKEQLNHGQWLPWLREHCGLSERTAQRYMQLIKHSDVIEAKSDTMSDLTINGALALLTTPQIAEKAIVAAESAEDIQARAERARLNILFDAFKAFRRQCGDP
jgi:Protein of unknown function (DUF3102)